MCNDGLREVTGVYHGGEPKMAMTVYGMSGTRYIRRRKIHSSKLYVWRGMCSFPLRGTSEV